MTSATRRLWLPSNWNGNYRFPKALAERLVIELSALRNREAAYKLAVFLSRFHAAPNTFGRLFVIDRRALDKHDKLGLTEDQVRGAIKALIRIGFIEKLLKGPERELGEKERSPVFYRFVGDFARLLARFARRAKDRFVSSNYPIEKESDEVAHLGEKGTSSYLKVASRIAERAMAGVKPLIRPANAPQRLTDGQVWQKVEKSLVGFCGGYGAFYAAVMERMNEEVMNNAIEAERARLGAGLTLITSWLKQPH